MERRATVNRLIAPWSSRFWWTSIQRFWLTSSLGGSLRANPHKLVYFARDFPLDRVRSFFPWALGIGRPGRARSKSHRAGYCQIAWKGTMRSGGPSRHVSAHFAEQHEDQRHQPWNLSEIHAVQFVRLCSHVEIRMPALLFALSLLLLAIFRQGLFIGIHSTLGSKGATSFSISWSHSWIKPRWLR